MKNLLVILALISPSLSWADSNTKAIFGSGDMRILEAFYGSGDRLCDATRDLAYRCDGHSECRIDAGNRLCGDPARGERKSLYLAYECGRGGREIILAAEGQDFSIVCERGGRPGGGHGNRPPSNERDRVFVNYVEYGAEGRVCDATPVFARQCDGRRNCQVRVNNRMCGDPNKGERKAAHIEFWCNGRIERGTIAENDTAYLSCP